MSLRARLLLMLLFAILVPAAVGGLQFAERRERETAAARFAVHDAAQRIARALQDTVRATGQLHYGLARTRDLESGDRAACSAFLADVLKEHDQYTGLLTARPDGTLFCDSLRTGRQVNVSDRRYFRTLMDTGEVLAVDAVFGRLTGLAVLQIAHAARDTRGAPRFVLLASLDLERFIRPRLQMLAGNEAVIALVTDGGQVLTWSPGGERLRGTSIAGTPLHRVVTDRRNAGAAEAPGVTGERWIWATASLPQFPDAGVNVLVGVSRQDLLGAANRNLAVALGTLAIVALLVFAAAWTLVERGVRRPAGRIVDAVARFSAGDLRARIGKPYPGGEFGALMGALDQAFDLTEAGHRRMVGGAEDLARTNRVLNVLSQSDQALVRAPDEDSLVRALCRVLVDFGGYERCSIDLTGEVAEPSEGPLAADATSIALPVRSHARVLGSLVVHAAQPGRFDPGEVALLTRLADDLGYGLQALRNRAELEGHRHRLEELVEQRAGELVAAHRELEAVSYSVSHDLRAPLRHVQAYAELIGEDAASRLSPEAARYLGVISGAGREMGLRIDELLAFLRLNRATLREVRVDLGPLVASVASEALAAEPGRNIVFEAGKLPDVEGDPDTLREAFAQLLGNAVKFTRGRDPAVIEVGCEGEEAGHAVLFVRDNGVGFDMAHAGQLFGIFQRLHPEDAFEGTGIGLAIVRRVVTRHGGRVWAEAVPGVGATFRITLRRFEG